MTDWGGSNRILTVVFHGDEGATSPVEVKEYGRREIGAFGQAVADAVREGGVANQDFAFGFLACLDVLANGMLDKWSPANVVNIARCDIDDPSPDGWVLTDGLRSKCRQVDDGRG